MVSGEEGGLTSTGSADKKVYGAVASLSIATARNRASQPIV